jgi:hypothetical protein
MPRSGKMTDNKPSDAIRRHLSRRAKKQMASVVEERDGKVITYGDKTSEEPSVSEKKSEAFRRKLRRRKP